MKKRIQRLLSFLISMVMLLAIQSVSASAHDEQYIPLGTGIAVDGSIINETKRELIWKNRRYPNSMRLNNMRNL